MVVYGIPNCSTVKKARTWLEENGIQYTFHDYKKHGITVEKLSEWMGAHPWEKLVNRAGTTFRKLSDEEKLAIVSPEAAQVLMMAQPSVIKRPIIEWNGPLVVGFDAMEYAQFLD